MKSKIRSVFKQLNVLWVQATNDIAMYVLRFQFTLLITHVISLNGHFIPNSFANSIDSLVSNRSFRIFFLFIYSFPNQRISRNSFDLNAKTNFIDMIVFYLPVRTWYFIVLAQSWINCCNGIAESGKSKSSNFFISSGWWNSKIRSFRSFCVFT